MPSPNVVAMPDRGIARDLAAGGITAPVRSSRPIAWRPMAVPCQDKSPELNVTAAPRPAERLQSADAVTPASDTKRHRYYRASPQAIDLRRYEAGQALKPSLRHAFIYSDCHGDDSRFVIANLLGAQRHKATILPRHRFLGAERSGKIWRVSLNDMRSGNAFDITCNALVNTAGPWVIDVAQKIAGVSVNRRLRMVRGSHIVVPRQWESATAFPPTWRACDTFYSVGRHRPVRCCKD